MAVDKDVKIGWTRWYKKAIKESANQIYGAERWVKAYPDRIYYDKECKEKFGLELPDNNELKIHRVAIASGASKFCSDYYGGGSSGTFVITPKIEGDDQFLFPFQIGNGDPNKGYVHVFNDLSIMMVLQECDTVGDFTDYLDKREVFLTSGKVLSIAGEEELLGFFLQNHFDYATNIDTVVDKIGEKDEFTLVLGEGDWSQYFYSAEYHFTKNSRQQSYLWDELIRKFDQSILAGDVPEWTDDHICGHERVLRLLARERRAYRQVLARNLYEKVLSVKPNERSARILPSAASPDSCFVFLCYGRELFEKYENYRTERRHYLDAYCYVVKMMNPQIRFIIGVATEQATSQGRSEDLIALDYDGWTAEDNNRAKSLQAELNIFKNINSQQKIGRNLLNEMFPWMRTPAGSTRKPGRNDPCPCGSDKKYKKCCFSNEFT